VKGKTDLQRNIIPLNFTSEQVMSNLAKWSETADDDMSKKDDDGTSSIDTSKKSTVKHSMGRKDRKERNISDDPRSKRENYEKE